MKDIPTLLRNHLLQDVSTLATCWLITLADGTVIRGTDHDRDIPVTASASPSEGLEGVYFAAANITASDIRSSADMSVDNMEVNGAFQSPALNSGDFVVPDLTPARIESGVADHAPVVVFIVNWQSPDDGQVIMRRGNLGEFSRDSDGTYRSEVRGLTQLLSQNIGTTYGERCDVKRFGDARCGFDVASVTRTAVVATVTSRRQFTATLTPGTDPPTANFFALGDVAFTAGANDGYSRAIKTATVAAGVITVNLWEELPEDVLVGDALNVLPGCDRRLETCRDVFDRLVSFRGYGVFIPGIDALAKGPV